MRLTALANPTRLGVLTVTVIIAIAPSFTAEGYSAIVNPISQLGAQHTQNSWLMNIGLCALGIGPGIDAWGWRRRRAISTVFLLIFSVAMLFTAYYSARPVDAGIAFDAHEELRHIFAAMVAGYAFALGAIGFAFREPGLWRKLACIVAAAAASIIPVFMFANPEITGLLQRIMLATCFLWLVVFLPRAAGQH